MMLLSDINNDEQTTLQVKQSIRNEHEVNRLTKHKAASITCGIEEDEAEEMTFRDKETLPLYNLKQKETVDNVVVNPELTTEQQVEVKQLLNEYREIFSRCDKRSAIF